MEYEKLADREGHFLFKKYTKDLFPKGLRGVPTFHNSIELIVVTGGVFEVYLNHEWREFEKGSVIYIDKLTPHATRATKRLDELEVYALVITLPYLSVISELEDMTFDTVLPHNDGFYELALFLKWGYDQFPSMNREMKCGFAAMLFGILKKHYQMKRRESQRQMKLLFGVMEFINENYRENITLDMLAQKFGYERTYLSKIFNRFLGMNLREYLNRCRVSMVNSHKKTNPELTLLQIAEQCGFDSPNTFYRAYKKYGG